MMCTLFNFNLRFLSVLAVIGLSIANFVLSLPTNVDLKQNVWNLGEGNKSTTSPPKGGSSEKPNNDSVNDDGVGMPIWLILLLVLLILIGIGMVIFVVCLFREDKEKDKKSHSKKKRSSSKHSANKKASVHSKKSSKKWHWAMFYSWKLHLFISVKNSFFWHKLCSSVYHFLSLRWSQSYPVPLTL